MPSLASLSRAPYNISHITYTSSLEPHIHPATQLNPKPSNHGPHHHHLRHRRTRALHLALPQQVQLHSTPLPQSTPHLTPPRHPVHPSTVHFPLTFLTTAYTLDTAQGLIPSLRPLTPLIPFLTPIAQIAYLSHLAGVLTSLPAMTSGTAELWELYKKGGINRVDKERTHPKTHEEVVRRNVKLGVVHGVLNVVALGVSTYAVFKRRGVKGWRAGRGGVVMGALMVPGVVVSAALGGEMVYGEGVGVQRMGGGEEEKRRGVRENVEKGR